MFILWLLNCVSCLSCWCWQLDVEVYQFLSSLNIYFADRKWTKVVKKEPRVLKRLYNMFKLLCIITGILSSCHTRETISVTSCLVSCTPRPLYKVVTLQRKNVLPVEIYPYFITKTRLFTYIEIFTTKSNENSQMKKAGIYHIAAQNIDCGYSPRRF